MFIINMLHKNKKLKPIEQIYAVNLGCDPEFFFANKAGEIIGSEKVIPKDGMNSRPKGEYRSGPIENDKMIIRDGIQAELNPGPRTCRQALISQLNLCIHKVYEEAKDKNINVDFSQGVNITEKEMSELDEESKQFGCAPSKNAYKKKTKIKITDASKYMFRSAGGHIHLGKSSSKAVNNALKNPKRTIPMLDLLLGNLCVLIDKDPNNKIRREVYGKAGEFREPSHGLEYRTLSNFWLNAPPLASLVLGMARVAVNLVASNKDKELLSLVRKTDIKKAINNNDFRLAKMNFNKIKKAYSQLIPNNYNRGYESPITGENMFLFNYFVDKGTKFWFNKTPLEHWHGSIRGFEQFLQHNVKPNYLKSKITN